MNVSQWIVTELIRRGVTYLSTLQGGYSMYLNDAIGHSALKPIYFQTESGAAYWAKGWAQATGQMGVCVITSGLAQTNAISGIAAAWSEYLPMMVISGDINIDLIIKRFANGLRQGGQQDVPIEQIAAPITKDVVIVAGDRQARTYFNKLWQLAMTEPRGPVWLNIPLDVQKMEIPDDDL